MKDLTSEAWEIHGSEWQNQCPLVEESPNFGSWLAFDGEGMACLCHWTNGPTARRDHFATFTIRVTAKTALNRRRFARHAATRSHQEAVVVALKKRGARAEDIDRVGAPDLEAFGQVLRETRTGGCSSHGVSGVGGKKKVRKMQWCIAEACRVLQRRFWRQACSMTVAQDKRGTRLLVRWRAASANPLKFRSGTLGLSREVSDIFAGRLGANSTRQGFLEMLKQAVTPRKA